MPRQDVGKSQPSAHMRYLLYSCAAIIVGKLEHLNVSSGRSLQDHPIHVPCFTDESPQMKLELIPHPILQPRLECPLCQPLPEGQSRE